MKYGAIIFSYLALFSVGFMENSRGAFYTDFIDLYNLNSKFGSLLFSISSLSSFIATISSRFWLFRFNSLTVSKFAVIALSVSSFLFYLITTNGISFFIFLLINILYGFSIGLLSISLNSLICEHSSLNSRQRVMSGLHSMYGLSSLLAPLIVSYIYRLGLDWKFIFIVCSLYSASIAIFSALIKQKDESFENKIELKSDVISYIIFGLIAALYVSSEILISSRLAYYLSTELAYSKIKAGIGLSFFFIFLFSGRLLFSFINIELNKAKLLKFSLSFTILIIVIGLYVHPFALSLSGFTMSFFFPYFLSFISERYPDYQKDLIAKSMNFVGAFLFIVHWLFGVISDGYGVKVAFFVPLLFLSLALYILHFGLTKVTLKASL